MDAPLRPFAFAHLVALGIVGAVTAACAFGVRSGPRAAATIRGILAVTLPLALLLLMILDARAGVSWRSYAPLQLCDVAVPLAVVALLTRHPLAFELTYAWSIAGTLPALLTPDVAEGFPHWRWLLYFAQHGGLVVAAGTLVAMGLRPRAWTPLRALLWLNVVALGIGAVDWVSGANFMYLRQKPGTATPLDWFGPWPLYIVTCEWIALAVFCVACAPLRLFRPERLSD